MREGLDTFNEELTIPKNTTNTFVLMLSQIVKRCSPLPSSSKIMILGAGFSGNHIAAVLKSLGNSVLCSRRNLEKPGADFVFDSEAPSLPPKNILNEVTHLLSCIPPTKDGEDPVLNKLNAHLKSMPLEWVGYLSTTGVYGNYEGDWVKETDPVKPKQTRSKNRLACEQSWQASELPVQILRLPGIYGPGRSALQNIQSGKSKIIEKPGQVFSRIHVDDIAGAIIYLMNLATKGERPSIVNIADNIPTSSMEIISYAASLLECSLPPIESFEIASKTMSPMALSFWEENRRVSNQLLCKYLGYELIHPDYKSGLKDCLIQEQSSRMIN